MLFTGFVVYLSFWNLDDETRKQGQSEGVNYCIANMMGKTDTFHSTILAPFNEH